MHPTNLRRVQPSKVAPLSLAACGAHRLQRTLPSTGTSPASSKPRALVSSPWGGSGQGEGGWWADEAPGDGCPTRGQPWSSHVCAAPCSAPATGAAADLALCAVSLGAPSSCLKRMVQQFAGSAVCLAPAPPPVPHPCVRQHDHLAIRLVRLAPCAHHKRVVHRHAGNHLGCSRRRAAAAVWGPKTWGSGCGHWWCAMG